MSQFTRNETGIKVYVRLPFSHVITKTDNPCFILTATRGCDSEKEVTKTLGASIIRYSIHEWGYGVEYSPQQLKDKIVTYCPQSISKKDVLKDVTYESSHYASHVIKALRELRDISKKVGSIEDYVYFDCLFSLWCHVGWIDREVSVNKALMRLRAFLLTRAFTKNTEGLFVVRMNE